MSISAFGVEHGEISKSDRKERKAEGKKMAKENTPDKKEYRRSVWQKVNPRSKTYVKRGTAPQRAAGVAAGGVAGSLVGGSLGALAGAAHKDPLAVKQGAQIGASLGGAAGGTAGYHRNIKSKDIVSVNRRSGKKAKSKFQSPFGIYNVY